MSKRLHSAISSVLGPLVRLMIFRGVLHPDVSEHLKMLFVEQAAANFAMEKKRLTDSRLSVLTGLQRRDVKRLREQGSVTTSVAAGPVARVILRWSTSDAWHDSSGNPLPLARRGSGPESFETLVASVSKDIHPRTVLDAMLSEGAVELDDAQDILHLRRDAYLPQSDENRLVYLEGNLGDHAEASIQNLVSDTNAAPFFERAAHFNQLSERSVRELDELARTLQTDALRKIASRAEMLQQQDDGSPAATHRFRCGAYIYFADQTGALDDQQEAQS